MFDVLEKLLKDYKKNLQKLSARATARALLQKKGAVIKEVKRSGETEAETAQSSISSATSGLQETVKGQFGQKVTQVFEDQKKMVNKL